MCGGSNLSTVLASFPRPNHAVGVYIINSVGIAYHQCEALYIIKPQENTRWRVMRYSPAGADDMHDCVVMICQACGLDKKILVPKNEDFLAGAGGLEPTTLGFGDRCSTD